MSNKKLYVGSLDYKVRDENLNEFFTTIGPVESARVIMDRETGRSKGFGFVEMATAADAEKAIRELNGAMLLDRAIMVSAARPEGAGGGRSGGGRSGGGRPGGGYGRGSDDRGGRSGGGWR